MNFFFGQVNFSGTPSNQQQWQDRSLFAANKDKTDCYSENGLALTLINDPQNIFPDQSENIFINQKFICISDCQLYNKAQLATTLNLNVSQSTNDFIIAAYERWGNDFVNQLDGPCSFVIWQREKRVLLAGRDALGYGNFCYYKNQNTIYFSSDLATLLDNPNIDKSINLKRLHQSLRYANNTPEQTYFAHCYYCPPSHILEMTQDYIKCNDYWQLNNQSDFSNLPDEASYLIAFNQILKNHLNQAINSKDDVLALLLSGGLDSNLLAAILASQPEHKEKLSCYSNVFTDYPDCDESRYINQTVNQLNLNSVQINCDDQLVLSDIETRFITKDVISQDLYASLPESLFKLASNAKSKVVIMGHYGDDLFAANKYLFADLIHNADIKSVIKILFSSSDKKHALYQLINYGIRTRLPKTIKRIYRTCSPTKIETNYFDIDENQVNTVEDEPRLKKTGFLYRQYLLRLVYYTNTCEGVYYYRKHLYLGHKMRLIMPYYCKAMIEFMWALPINFTRTVDENRHLQRQCLRLLGLKHIANRAESTTFSSLIDPGIKKNKAMINKILEKLALLNAITLDKKKISNLINKQTLSLKENIAITQVVFLELWLNCVNTENESHNQLKKCNISKQGINYTDAKTWLK